MKRTTKVIARTVVVLLGFLATGLATNAFGQAIGIFGDSRGWSGDCEINWLSSPVFPAVRLYVVVHGSYGVRGVSFAAPAPDCLEYLGWGYQEEPGPGVALTGDVQNGVIATFDDCRPGHTLVLTMTLPVVSELQDCCYPIVAHPSSASGMVEFIDCDFGVIARRGGYGRIGNPSIMQNTSCDIPTGGTPPSNPFPADGDSGVPVDARLTWYATLPMVCPPILDAGRFSVFFGTAPNPPQVRWMQWEDYLDAGPLEPETTYYWRVSILGGGSGPVWQFTTGASTPTKQSSWGSIKALFSAL